MLLVCWRRFVILTYSGTSKVQQTDERCYCTEKGAPVWCRLNHPRLNGGQSIHSSDSDTVAVTVKRETDSHTEFFGVIQGLSKGFTYFWLFMRLIQFFNVIIMIKSSSGLFRGQRLHVGRQLPGQRTFSKRSGLSIFAGISMILMIQTDVCDREYLQV